MAPTGCDPVGAILWAGVGRQLSYFYNPPWRKAKYLLLRHYAAPPCAKMRFGGWLPDLLRPRAIEVPRHPPTASPYRARLGIAEARYDGLSKNGLGAE